MAQIKAKKKKEATTAGVVEGDEKEMKAQSHFLFLPLTHSPFPSSRTSYVM